MADSYVKRAITYTVHYASHVLLLNLVELDPFWEMSSSPNRDARSPPFLAHSFIFPLIQSRECG